jgi:hypothetical protein
MLRRSMDDSGPDEAIVDEEQAGERAEQLVQTSPYLRAFAERMALAERIAAIQRRFSASVDVAESLALALHGASVWAPVEERVGLVARAQLLVDAFPGSEVVAESLAFCIRNTTGRASTREVAVAVERIEALCDRLPWSEELADALASTLARSTRRQPEATVCAEVVQRVDELSQRFPTSEMAAGELARALVHESFARATAAERAAVVARIELLHAAMPTAPRIAGQLAMAICSVSIETPSAAAILQLAARIDELRGAFPTQPHVLAALARTFANATFASRGAADPQAIVARLRELQSAHTGHPRVAEELAVALVNLTQRTATAATSLPIVDEIERLHALHPCVEIAHCTASAMRNASADVDDVDGRERLVARLQAVHDVYRDDESIAEQLASTRIHAWFDTVDVNARASHEQAIAALHERWPRSSAIAFELARVHFGVAVRADDCEVAQAEFARLGALSALFVSEPWGGRYAWVAGCGRRLARDGCTLVERAVDGDSCAAITACLDAGLGEVSEPARRDVLEQCAGLRAMLAASPLSTLARDLLGGKPHAIAAILFDKQPGSNWVVAAHQDLAMPFAERTEAEGYSGWTTKGGVPHALPPDRVLQRLVALRLHLDDCPADNGALAVLPGSHARGRWAPGELAALRSEQFAIVAARRGDVLALRPLLVHRSAPAVVATRRRVLHIVYANSEPSPLRWRTR